MTGNSAETSANPTYAIGIANDSYEWYKSHAIRSRKAYRVSETAVLVVSAAIPAAAAITPHDAVIPAILGALVVIYQAFAPYSIGRIITLGSAGHAKQLRLNGACTIRATRPMLIQPQGTRYWPHPFPGLNKRKWAAGLRSRPSGPNLDFRTFLSSAEELDAERGSRAPAVLSVPPQSRRGGPGWSVPIPQTQSRPTCGTCTQPRRAQPPLGRAARPGHRPARRVLPPVLERRSGPRGGRSRPEQGGDGVSR